MLGAINEARALPTLKFQEPCFEGTANLLSKVLKEYVVRFAVCSDCLVYCYGMALEPATRPRGADRNKDSPIPAGFLGVLQTFERCCPSTIGYGGGVSMEYPCRLSSQNQKSEFDRVWEPHCLEWTR